ncbi:hypothetical protein [Halobacillus salinus]|uniref:hypothetical protein n=1 Tax=Halobacillus salinus TaxID=192814 RepID=UPI0009A60AB5|nr:hypothetical protein [Halobacillus salinus]
MLKSRVLNFVLAFLLLLSAAHDIDRLLSNEGFAWLNVTYLASSLMAGCFFFYSGVVRMREEG